MKREIKFRAWMPYNEDPNDMRMEYYPQLFAEDGNGIFNINSVFAHPIDYFADNGTYPEAVIKFMEYTGLHDKNEREIYEGDIVKNEYGQVMEVQYFPESAAFGVGYYYLRTIGAGTSLEVIGNIFEDKQLLEVTEHDN